MNGYYSDQYGYYMVRDMIALCQGRRVEKLPWGVLWHNVSLECWSDGTPIAVSGDRNRMQYARHKQRIEDADLSFPLIVLSDGYYVLDGFHRLCKAMRLNLPFISCFLLSRADLESIRRSWVDLEL